MEAAIIMGIATAFNILIIIKKLEKGRLLDAFLDGGILVTLSLVMGLTLGGMMVATVASAIISLYFIKYPPFAEVEWDNDDKIEAF